VVECGLRVTSGMNILRLMWWRKTDILNTKCDDANCDMSNNDLDCLEYTLISFLCTKVMWLIAFPNYLAIFLTFIFHKIVYQRVLGMVGSLMTALLQFSGECQWKNFKNRSIFCEVMTKTWWCTFLTHRVRTLVHTFLHLYQWKQEWILYRAVTKFTILPSLWLHTTW